MSESIQCQSFCQLLTKAACTGSPEPTHLKAQTLQVDAGVDLLEVETRRDLAVLQRQGHLDDGGQARRSLSVADIRLHGGHIQRVATLAAALTQRLADGQCLARVTNSRARSMRLHQRCLQRIQASSAIALRNEAALGRGVWSGDTRGPPVLVGARLAYYRTDRVAIADGVREALHDHGTDTLSSTVPLSSVVKGIALAVRPAETILGISEYFSVSVVSMARSVMLTYPVVEMSENREGLTKRLAPPTTAASESPDRRLWQARWRPMSDVEHAVVIDVL